jgi:hypothetical protein
MEDTRQVAVVAQMGEERAESHTVVITFCPYSLGSLWDVP